MAEKLLEIQDLKKYYPLTAGLLARHVADVQAVDGVSLYLTEGETLGLVGESGCGKSTLGRTMLRLEEPTGGHIFFRGEEITTWERKKLKRFRREVQMVFQDPESSLDPRMTIDDSIGEALGAGGVVKESARREKTAELLARVGLNGGYASRYPYELSGGQKQRIGIARALAVNPKLIIADEPVSALDVSVQAQIINLLADLQRDAGLAYLFIAHDLAVIGQVADRVAVMYLGQIIETAGRDELIAGPRHPYTMALVTAVTLPDPHRRRTGIALAGEVPSPVAPPPGCRFQTRCPRVMTICRNEQPVWREPEAGHRVFCHLYD